MDLLTPSNSRGGIFTVTQIEKTADTQFNVFIRLYLFILRFHSLGGKSVANTLNHATESP